MLACVCDGSELGSLQRRSPVSPNGMHGWKCHTLGDEGMRKGGGGGGGGGGGHTKSKE